jgi:hypothetical protein
MLLKEYRICMPITVDEYRLGQLYMIARHSREESENGEGVEVVLNEPCSDPVHGEGQYTEKRIYLHHRLPVVVQSMLPRIFYIIEKSWNYYPFTMTEYTCSFLPKFLIQIDTTYQDNDGSADNALNLPPDLLAQREVDHVDIVKDAYLSREPTPEDDCTKFVSSKTGRGPLLENWKEIPQPNYPIMCSYKVIKVFFEVWGFQTRVEAGVHRAVRDIILKGHKQAFLWIDEWHGLTNEDIREYERKIHEETNQLVLGGINPSNNGATP